MTAEEVTAAIGQPDRVVGRAYDYPRYGLGVYLDKEGRVNGVVGGGWCEPRAPMIDAFRKYRTAKGLGVESAPEDLRARLGEPDAIDGLEPAEAGMTVWRYDRQGVRFALHGGRVIHITVVRPRQRR